MTAPVSMSSDRSKMREAAHGASGVDLVHLDARHPSQRVEIVDRGVSEQSTRQGDVRVWRWLVVMSDEPNEVDGPELTGLDHPTGLDVGRIEPSLESELEHGRRSFDSLDELARDGEVERERLLAEDRQAAVEGHRYQRGMRVGRGSDDRRVRCVEGFLGGIHVPTADRVGGSLRSLGIDVGDDDVRDARLASNEPAVQLSDPARTEESDLHLTRLTGERRRRRLRRRSSCTREPRRHHSSRCSALRTRTTYTIGNSRKIASAIDGLTNHPMRAAIA